MEADPSGPNSEMRDQGFHLKLAYYNQTTIESDTTEYDVGWRNNLESIFGDNPWLWLIPVVGKGPIGDGIHWPQNGDPDGEGDVDLGRRAVHEGEEPLYASDSD